MSVGVYGRGRHTADVYDSAGLPRLLGLGVDPDVGVGTGVQRPGSEGLDCLIEALGHLGDLGAGYAFDAEGLHDGVDPAGGYALYVALGHHRHQSPLSPPTGLQQPGGEVAAGAKLGDRQIEAARAGVEVAGTVAVSGVGALGASLPVVGPADRVGLRPHQGMDERGEHLLEQIDVRLLHLLA